MIGAPAPLTEPSERNLAALRRAIVRTRRFGLYVIVAPDRARAEVLSRLRAWSGREGVPELGFLPSGAEGAQRLSAILAEPSAREPLRGLVVPDADRLVEEGLPIEALNVVRDRLGDIIKGPLVLVLSPRREVELGRMAPDLFDVRAATCEVHAIEAEAEAETAPAPTILALAAPPALTRRSPTEQDLRALEASKEGPPGAALADAWLRTADARTRVGDHLGAAASAGEALRLALGAGYRFGEASARIRLADAERLTGRPDEALEGLQRALTIAEQIAHAPLRARALGSIADILKARGQLDEALRIRKEEELPVHEKLGDIRERAITLGKVADILEARGQLDEAVRIRREEQLPVHEKLGDRRSLLVGRTNLALLLLQRAAEGDREEAARLLSLALSDALEMKLPEADAIQEIQREHGL